MLVALGRAGAVQQLYKAMHTDSSPCCSPALAGARQQLLPVMGALKGILASQAWLLRCCYSLFGKAKAGNAAAGWWRSSVSSQVCLVLLHAAMKGLVVLLWCCY